MFRFVLGSTPDGALCDVRCLKAFGFLCVSQTQESSHPTLLYAGRAHARQWTGLITSVIATAEEQQY